MFGQEVWSWTIFLTRHSHREQRRCRSCWKWQGLWWWTWSARVRLRVDTRFEFSRVRWFARVELRVDMMLEFDGWGSLYPKRLTMIPNRFQSGALIYVLFPVTSKWHFAEVISGWQMQGSKVVLKMRYRSFLMEVSQGGESDPFANISTRGMYPRSFLTEKSTPASKRVRV